MSTFPVINKWRKCPSEATSFCSDYSGHVLQSIEIGKEDVAFTRKVGDFSIVERYYFFFKVLM